ncbi:NADH:flavin oxidoreductase [Sphingobium sp. B2]|uniref:NADH:flavin oxidoreductase n=1 Tax=Sphingobium sp. B2 TaxID=2583228 RepID=UPI0011A8F5E8|nr:NADH:flavin oxidoreductase [Sphingobium sp. B2]
MVVDRRFERDERAALFTPLTVRSVTFRNRIVMSPMTRGYCPDGIPDEAVLAYYRRRAEGGTGLIITEGVAVDHAAALGDAGLGENNIPLLAGDRAIAGWRMVTDAVHAAGGKIIPQLWHQGAMRKPGTGPFPKSATVSPSGIWGPLGRMTSIAPSFIPSDPHIGEPMTECDIEDAIAAFERCAKNALVAGFDGIALHGGHGYLIDNFLWEGTNRRQDRWGGDRARRSAFGAEIVRRIRTSIGEEFPIFFRFSQWKQQDFRAKLADTPEELAEVLCPLADAGVDVFDASVRYFNSAAFERHPGNLAGWAKRITGKLSMAVGGVGMNHGMYDKGDGAKASDDFEPLIQRFKQEEFDLVAVGRGMIGDPLWADKFRSRREFLPYIPENDATLF